MLLKMCSDQLKKLSFAQLLVEIRKKITPYGASMHFLKNEFLKFSRKLRHQTLAFHFKTNNGMRIESWSEISVLYKLHKCLKVTITTFLLTLRQIGLQVHTYLFASVFCQFSSF